MKMGIFKVNKDDLKGRFIGFIKGSEVELFTFGQRKVNINEVETVEILK